MMCDSRQAWKWRGVREKCDFHDSAKSSSERTNSSTSTAATPRVRRIFPVCLLSTFFCMISWLSLTTGSSETGSTDRGSCVLSWIWSMSCPGSQVSALRAISPHSVVDASALAASPRFLLSTRPSSSSTGWPKHPGFSMPGKEIQYEIRNVCFKGGGTFERPKIHDCP